jgi:hypothetical protein
LSGEALSRSHALATRACRVPNFCAFSKTWPFYSVLVVMDDGLLSTAILILFFDDRGSVGLVRLSFLDDGGAVAVSMFAGLSYSHAGAIWSGLNANADLISKGGVAMVPTGAANRTPFDCSEEECPGATIRSKSAGAFRAI